MNTLQYNILLFDVKEFSKIPNHGQLAIKEKLKELLDLVKEKTETTPYFNPTGDGYYIGIPYSKNGFIILVETIANITETFEDWAEFRFLLHYGEADVTSEIHGEEVLSGLVLNESMHMLSTISAGNQVFITKTAFEANLGKQSNKGNHIGSIKITKSEPKQYPLKHNRQLEVFNVIFLLNNTSYGQSFAEVERSQLSKVDQIKTKDIKKLIETIYSNKVCIEIGDYVETDVQGSNIRYSYLSIETAPKTTRYFLHIDSRSVKSKTIEHFVRNNKVGIPLTVLANKKTTSKEKNHSWQTNLLRDLRHAISNSIDSEEINFQYLDEFIWDEIIPRKLKTPDSNIVDDESFVEPSIEATQGAYGDNIRASGMLSQWILDNSGKPIAVLKGAGGWGKTTLLRKVYRTLIKNSNQIRKIFLFLDAQQIVRSLSGAVFKKASSLSDIISINNQINRSENNTAAYPSYFEDPDIIKLSISSGNLVVIIDGIDEIASRSETRLTLTNFLVDLLNVHEILNHSKILLGMRDHFWDSESQLEDSRFCFERTELFKLLGFSQEITYSYFEKVLDNNQNLAKEAMKLLGRVSSPSEKYFWPFVAYLIADQLRRNLQDLQPEPISSRYLILTDPFDKVVGDVLQREITRQELELEVDDFLDIFKEIIFIHKSKISRLDFEAYVELFETKVQDKAQLAPKLLTNPFFEISPSEIGLRHDFFEKRMTGIFISFQISHSQIPDNVLEKMSQIKHGNAEIVSYCSSRLKVKDDPKYVVMNYYQKITTLRENTRNDRIRSDNAKKAESFLIYLYIWIRGEDKRTQPAFITECLEELTAGTLRGVCIYGPFYPMNLSGKTLTDWYLQEYDSLTNSSLANSRFVDCHVSLSKKLEAELQEDNDRVKKIGNLTGIGEAQFEGGYQSTAIATLISSSKRSLEAEIDALKTDFRNILKRFYFDREDGFSRHPKKQILISMRSSKKFESLFDLLISMKVIRKVNTIKGAEFELSEEYRTSVRSLVKNNYQDAKFDAIWGRIKSKL